MHRPLEVDGPLVRRARADPSVESFIPCARLTLIGTDLHFLLLPPSHTLSSLHLPPRSLLWLPAFKMLQAILGLSLLATEWAPSVSLPGASSYVAAPGFPTSAFSYDTPTPCEVQID